ncbi:MAG: CatB-related O-acetyltransferase [Proteobacteria bacterium]|nr:CatB-related O-acetyltransferase [Pseudomonadota bacterium]
MIYTREHLAHFVDTAGFDIGEHSYGNPRLHWWGEPSILKIGRYCSIAEGVEIFLGGNHRTDWITTYPFSALDAWPEAHSIEGHPATKGNVVVGNDVWLGHSSVVLSGVTIGDGAVVGARAVVTRDVPPYAIVAGNPARVLRYRFPDEVIAQLLAVEWWDWPDERVRAEIPRLLSSDVADFLASSERAPAAKPGIARRLARLRSRLLRQQP